MKVKECRESICKDMGEIRCSGDMELVRRIMDLIISLKKGKDTWEDGAIEKWLLITKIMNGGLSPKGLRQLCSYCHGMEQAEKERENHDRTRKGCIPATMHVRAELGGHKVPRGV